MTSKNLTPKPVTLPRRALTSAEFSQLEDVPPETEWFANIDNPHTRRAYRNDLKEFMTFAGIGSIRNFVCEPDDLITRSAPIDHQTG
jgi:hypothetical protein